MWQQRAMLVIAGLLALCIGIGALHRGSFLFRNFWDGIGFAPFAILIGMLCFAAAARIRKG